MDIIKELRKGDKVVFKKVKDLPDDAKEDEISDYSKFAGKTVTVNTILKRTNDNVFFDIEEDEDSYSFANVFVCSIKGYDEISTKSHSFGVGVIEKVLPRKETKTANKETTEKEAKKALIDFVEWIDEHTRIDGTALYQDYLKSKGKENE